MKKVLCAFIALVMLTLSMSGCGGSYDSVKDEMFALDTIIRFTLYDEDEELCKSTIDKCKAEIVRLENLLSATKEGSDIYTLNNAQGESITVSDETAAIIKSACDISKVTDGAFDITIRPLMSAWGFDTKEYKVPSADEINTALEKVSYENITLDDNQVTLEQGMAVDLGAIAKGYIGDRVREILSDSSVYSAIIDMGGMIITKGESKSADEKFWNIGLQYPDDSGDCFLTFKCSYPAVSTSGGYQRYFESDGVKYHHIIDSKTGKPAQSDISSVTVVGNNGYECDALSTAFYVMGVDKTVDYINTHKSGEDDGQLIIMLSSDKKTLYVSEEFKTYDSGVTLLDGYKDEIEIVYI